MNDKLTLKNISKNYKDKEVLHSINLEFESGLYGLLGPNGAGKTTLLNIMVGILEKSCGTIEWNGNDIFHNPEEYRSGIGFLPQHLDFYHNFTGEQFLEYMSKLKEVDSTEVNRVLNVMNLESVRSKKISSYSGGMKQRLGIAQAILGSPKLLVLDEPTVGLDLEERAHFKKYLKDLSNESIVILSTHIVSDVEEVSDHVIFLKNGQIQKQIANDQLSHLEELYLSVQEEEC